MWVYPQLQFIIQKEMGFAIIRRSDLLALVVLLTSPTTLLLLPSFFPFTEAGSKVFREYIGGGATTFKEVPIVNSSSIEFHFILAFALDHEQGGDGSFHYTNGKFKGFWQPTLTPEGVKEIKANHGNVKVMLSIGGAGVVSGYNPTTVSTWVANAVTSLTEIIKDYELDGIDIDYEEFEGSSSNNVEDFVSGVGQLITILKQQGVITFASIAPYPSVDHYYTALWLQYGHVIDYVNYQFYSQGSISLNEYLLLYNYATTSYKGATVLASFETVNNGNQIVPDSGYEACQELEKQGKLPGVFIWYADQSYNNFQYEIKAQSLLTT